MFVPRSWPLIIHNRTSYWFEKGTRRLGKIEMNVTELKGQNEIKQIDHGDGSKSYGVVICVLVQLLEGHLHTLSCSAIWSPEIQNAFVAERYEEAEELAKAYSTISESGMLEETTVSIAGFFKPSTAWALFKRYMSMLYQREYGSFQAFDYS